MVLTGVGFGTGVADGFALADLLGVWVTEALGGAAVVAEAALDEPAPGVALEAAALETAALVTAALETAGAADDATALGLARALDGVRSGAA